MTRWPLSLPPTIQTSVETTKSPLFKNPDYFHVSTSSWHYNPPFTLSIEFQNYLVSVWRLVSFLGNFCRNGCNRYALDTWQWHYLPRKIALWYTTMFYMSDSQIVHLYSYKLKRWLKGRCVAQKAQPMQCGNPCNARAVLFVLALFLFILVKQACFGFSQNSLTYD